MPFEKLQAVAVSAPDVIPVLYRPAGNLSGTENEQAYHYVCGEVTSYPKAVQG